MHLFVEGLMHRFAGRREWLEAAIDIAELTAEPGRLTVVTGPSGSGKSTLLYLLSGLLRATAGQVRWDDVDLAGLGETARDKWRRAHAGFVFQNFHLVGEMTALANVCVPAYFGHFTAAGVRDRAAALLDMLGVPLESRPAASYSRGEQQRIAVARALIFDPGIVFADEPTASLDAVNADEIAARFAALADAGKTVVAVSHDPAIISRASQVIALDHGRRAAEVGSRAA